MTIRSEVVFFSALAMLLPLSAPSAAQMAGPDNAQNFLNQQATGLVQAVRLATAKYQNVSQAIKDGYQADANGCVSSPDEGAMGVHYINGSLIGGGPLDAAHPQGLVYEPLGNGRLGLVAVEYITIAQLWDGSHTDGSPAKLIGQEFDYMEAPNRFRLPAVYNLHVWAWKYNPMGVFSMWNPNVSCDSYTE
ncbi:hypothetical protein [Rhodanobacter sp. C03]|uniref:hypothetical protein n=1 Tax=Rhodanobacter sp. C03 TaxID=1945858 RepID=UPI0009C4491A|nr:hypothetical protein [Rhodanobacter sp. C03]OOG56200.1 hypothetical protein B0E48_08305 [Rhodanobacter sp. C03]